MELNALRIELISFDRDTNTVYLLRYLIFPPSN